MTEKATLLVSNIGELATCDPTVGDAPGVIQNAVIAARGERLLYVGPRSGARSLARAAHCVEIDAQGAAVIPGFVDCHTHAIWCGDRSAEYALRARGETYEAIAAQGGGIRSTIRQTSPAPVEELVLQSRPRLRRMLAHGTTTVEIKSGYGGDTDSELRILEAARLLGSDPQVPSVMTTYLPLHAAPERDRTDFVDAVCSEGLARAHPLADFVDAFCETGAFTVAECRQLFTAAARHGLRLKLHAEQRTHSGAALLAAEVGATSADHLEHATLADCRRLAAAGVVGVMLPGAALVLGGPPPPGRRLRQAGAVMAIATDCNPGTCNSESMPLMLSLAVATAGLTPAEALLAATSGGAAALGLGDRGVLRTGARADFCVLQDRHWLDVAYHLGAQPIAMVIAGGSVVP